MFSFVVKEMVAEDEVKYIVGVEIVGGVSTGTVVLLTVTVTEDEVVV